MPTATSSARWPPGAPAARAARRRWSSQAETPRQRQEGDGRADQHERRAAERLRALAGELEALERRVDRQEGEQPDRERHHAAQPGGRDAPDPGQPEHAERDRDHADVDPEQRHQAEEREVGRRASRPRRGSRARSSRPSTSSARPRRPRPRPRAAAPHRGGLEPADRLLGAGELHERVVDLRLGDRDSVGPVVAHRQLDRARPQHGLLDRELLRGRPAPLAEPGAAEQREGSDRRRRSAAAAPAPSSHTGSRRCGRAAGRARSAARASISRRPRRSPASRAR